MVIFWRHKPYTLVDIFISLINTLGEGFEVTCTLREKKKRNLKTKLKEQKPKSVHSIVAWDENFSVVHCKVIYIYMCVWFKSDLTDKMKHSFFQAAVVSIPLYECSTWTLKKRLEKKLDGNYTRMLRAISNKSWRQHPTKHQLYGYLPPITKTMQVRRTRHAGQCCRNRD